MLYNKPIAKSFVWIILFIRIGMLGDGIIIPNLQKLRLREVNKLAQGHIAGESYNRTQGKTMFTSLLKGMIKDADKDRHRVRCGRVLSVTASVPMELGCIIFLVWMCLPLWKLCEPRTVGISSRRHDRFAAPLLWRMDGGGVGLKIPSL